MTIIIQIKYWKAALLISTYLRQFSFETLLSRVVQVFDNSGIFVRGDSNYHDISIHNMTFTRRGMHTQKVRNLSTPTCNG